MGNKNVLLVGSSGGLGQHFAKSFASAGYNLALHYLTGSEKMDILKSELSLSNIKVNSYKADISSETEVAGMIGKIQKDLGGIDILINNAGISIDGMSWKLGLDDWNKVLSVNLTGPFLCIKHTLPLMRQSGWGRIINITSVVSQIGVPGTSAYSASKAALTGLTKTVSKEVMKYNITVNQISLGYFQAGMLFKIPEDIREQIKTSIPKKEFGNPEEIVRCMLYLVDEKANYITGQTININGGLY